MNEIRVRTALEAERSRVVSALVAGFLSDPVARWCWPEPDAYLANAAKFMNAYGGRAFENDCAWTDQEFRGGALWLPPGVAPDEEELGHAMTSTVAEAKQGHLFAALEELVSCL